MFLFASRLTGIEKVLCLRNVWWLAGISRKSYITTNIFTTVLLGLNKVWRGQNKSFRMLTHGTAVMERDWTNVPYVSSKLKGWPSARGHWNYCLGPAGDLNVGLHQLTQRTNPTPYKTSRSPAVPRELLTPICQAVNCCYLPLLMLNASWSQLVFWPCWLLSLALAPLLAHDNAAWALRLVAALSSNSSLGHTSSCLRTLHRTRFFLAGKLIFVALMEIILPHIHTTGISLIQMYGKGYRLCSWTIKQAFVRVRTISCFARIFSVAVFSMQVAHMYIWRPQPAVHRHTRTHRLRSNPNPHTSPSHRVLKSNASFKGLRVCRISTVTPAPPRPKTPPTYKRWPFET